MKASIAVGAGPSLFRSFRTRGHRRRNGHGSRRLLRCELLESRQLLSSTPSATGGGFGVAGDSLSDEYNDARSGASYDYAENWVQLLATHRGIDFGPEESNAKPRLDGYAYNWARYGATTSTLLSEGQHTGLAKQIQNGLVDQAVLMIGQNDFIPSGSAYFGIYAGTWTAKQTSNYANELTRRINTALKTLKTADVQLVVSNICDYGVAPLTRRFYTDWTKRERVTRVIQGVNARIRRLAQGYGIPMVDLFGLAKQYLGTNRSPSHSLVIGGVTVTNDGGTEPNHVFVGDSIHPHTLVQAAIANTVLEAFREGYGSDTPLFSEREMVEMVGLTYVQDTLNLDFSKYVFVPQPTTISINDVRVAEPSRGTTNAVFTVSLSAATARTVTVAYTTIAGTARSGNDFKSAKGTLTFKPGETQKKISVVVLPDKLDEIDETFRVKLSGANSATLPGGTVLATGTIVDDDPQPKLAVADVSVKEGNSKTTEATFNVTLSAASGKTVTVDYATADDRAGAHPANSTAPGNDYAPAQGTLTFLPGQTSKTITVLVNGDKTHEWNETFLLDLSGEKNATLRRGTAKVTIRNDDAAPAISLAGQRVTEGLAGTVMELRKKQPVKGDRRINWEVWDEFDA